MTLDLEQLEIVIDSSRRASLVRGHHWTRHRSRHAAWRAVGMLDCAQALAPAEVAVRVGVLLCARPPAWTTFCGSHNCVQSAGPVRTVVRRQTP